MFGLKDRKALNNELKELKRKVSLLEEELQMEREKNSIVSGHISEMENSAEAIRRSTNVVGDVTEALSKITADTLSAERDISEASEKGQRELEKDLSDLSRLTAALSTQKSRLNKLMEDSKEYTGISKNLQSMVDTYKSAAATIAEEAGKMEEYSGNMGTLSLNAAIEAGRMGENGMRFVRSVDEVRSFAETYEQSASVVKEKSALISESFEKAAVGVEKLISLLKDNTLLLKKISDSCKEECDYADSVERKDAGSVFAGINEGSDTVREKTEEIIKQRDRLREDYKNLEKERKALTERASDIKETVTEEEGVKNEGEL
ncbi:MAG: hypothetical protein K6A69_01800 [Lachnospiraceae bacterium]|nr:hypothetical protein [Lachnospiraceae bacterium]